MGIFAALLSAASWAFGTVMFDRIGKVVPYVGITFLKGVLSLLLMVILVVCNGGLQRISISSFCFLAVSGVVGIAVGDSLFFKSLQDLGAKVQVIFFLLGQILTMVLSFLFLGELLTVGQYVGIFILLSGIVVVIWGKQENHPNKLRGVVYALGSMLCFSASAILVKLSVADVEVITATWWRMAFGTSFVLAFGLISKQLPAWIYPLRSWRLTGLFLLNVVVITYGGFLFSIVAYKYTTVSLVSVLGTMEPVFVLFLAFLINGERVIQREVIGTAITLVGLYFILIN